MAFDATFLSGVLEEIRAAALGGRVEKLYQPARDTVVLLLRGEAGRVRLLIVANPAAPRLHLTGTNPENPDQPPMFCMLLRKHLLGGRLTAVEQLPMERAAIFTFLCTDEMVRYLCQRYLPDIPESTRVLRQTETRPDNNPSH